MSYRDTLKNLANQSNERTFIDKRATPLSIKEYEKIADIVEAQAKQKIEQRIRQKDVMYDYTGFIGRKKNFRYEAYVRIAFIMSTELDEQLYYYQQMMKIAVKDHETEYIVIQTKYWDDVAVVLNCIGKRLKCVGFDGVKIREASSFYADTEDVPKELNIEEVLARIKTHSRRTSTTLQSFQEFVISVSCDSNGHIT